ncbi:MAG: polyprenyl synthetase family protein [Lachnospiraceae bacterium]
MTEKDQDIRSYQSFYKEVYRRLSRKQKALSRRLGKDENSILRTVRQDLADLNVGGKLLRGMLVVLGYKIALDAAKKTKDLSYADDLALAFETFQTGVLVHDDIIDKAELRRGKKTIPFRYEQRMEENGIHGIGENDDLAHLASSIAICAGDFALYEAVHSISVNYMGDEALGSLVCYFSETVLETIRGELLDVILPYELQTFPNGEKEQLLEKSVEEIYRLKTARYSVVGPLHLGMLLGGASPQKMKALDTMTEELGIAYQIMDDILGIFADTKALGKDVGSDISEFKQTILYQYIHNRNPECLPALLRFYGKPAGVEELAKVQDIFRESGALEYANAQMELCFARALEKLASLRWMSAEDKAILRGFIEYCRGRSY